MKGTIKTTVAFRYLLSRHEKEARDLHAWGVYSVKKDGGLYAQPGSTHATREEAEKQAAYVTKLNPGKTFVVEELI
jgi:hypothetical protein